MVFQSGQVLLLSYWYVLALDIYIRCDIRTSHSDAHIWACAVLSLPQVSEHNFRTFKAGFDFNIGKGR